MKKLSKQYSQILLDNVLRYIGKFHPNPVFLGAISLEFSCSLEIIKDVLEELCSKNLVREASKDERVSRGLQKEHSVFVLTESGKEVLQRNNRY